MYDRITADIKQPYYVHHFPNDGPRFVAWYLRNIHLLDPNEARDAITDGADDKQIDAVVVDDDRSTVLVVQGKFIGGETTDAEALREVLSSWVQLKDLVKLQEDCNPKLKRKLAEIAAAFDEDYDVLFELITTGSLTPAAQKDLARFQEELASAQDFPATIHLVDQGELQRRYELALDRENPSIRHTMRLEGGRYMAMEVAGTQALVAALPLKECLSIPGIKDGTLFQKNVRQSLGLSNAVNKGIKSTIYGDKYRDFFFFHNGITAICSRMELGGDHRLTVHGLSVVNGCQSLNTILSCSERVKELDDTYILCRFYEIPQRDRADRISISTNSQSAVKPRDLRSNDKRVLALKRAFEQKYPSGYFTTKRGEEAPADKDPTLVVDMADLGKNMMAWHSQRPNMSYSETRIFDKYFEQLFKRDTEYAPDNAQALNSWMQEVRKAWKEDNPLQLNESLLAMKAYAPYHHLYAVSVCCSIANGHPDRVPSPAALWERMASRGQAPKIVEIAGTCLNSALEAAANEPQSANRVFSPQNWIKAKTCLSGINAAVRQYLAMLPTMPGGKEFSKTLQDSLKLPAECFDYRWAAD